MSNVNLYINVIFFVINEIFDHRPFGVCDHRPFDKQKAAVTSGWEQPVAVLVAHARPFPPTLPPFSCNQIVMLGSPLTYSLAAFLTNNAQHTKMVITAQPSKIKVLPPLSSGCRLISLHFWISATGTTWRHFSFLVFNLFRSFAFSLSSFPHLHTKLIGYTHGHIRSTSLILAPSLLSFFVDFCFGRFFSSSLFLLSSCLFFSLCVLLYSKLVWPIKLQKNWDALC